MCSFLDDLKVVLKCINIRFFFVMSLLYILKIWVDVNYKNIMGVLLRFIEKDIIGIVLELFLKSFYDLIYDYCKVGI